MSPGEFTLIKIVGEGCDLAAAQERFHQAFPSGMSAMAFDAVVRSLTKRGLLRKTKLGLRLELTDSGRAELLAEQRAEEYLIKGEGRNSQTGPEHAENAEQR